MDHNIQKLVGQIVGEIEGGIWAGGKGWRILKMNSREILTLSTFILGDSGGQTDKYRGGYFFEGNSWGRYLHINNMKSYQLDEELDDFKR